MKYQPKRKADPDQVKALKALHGKEFFGLLMEQRVRKSKPILDDFGMMELDKEVQDMLIIGPGGSYHNWEYAMQDDLSEDLLERSLRHRYSSGAGVNAQKRLDYFISTKDKSRPRILLMNIEAFSRPGDGRDLAREFISQRKCITTIDESVVIKNSSKRTEFVNKFIKPNSNYRRILSGMVSPRSPLDLFFQMQFLSENILGFNSYINFMRYIAHVDQIQFGGRWPANVINKKKGDNGFKPEAVAELQQMIAPHTIRIKFKPNVPSTYSIREVEMTKEQKKAYKEMLEFSTTMLGEESHVTATVVIAQIMKLHQILCGHVKDEDGNEITLPENKTSAVMELLEDYSGKAIIWCSYDHDIRKIAAKLEDEYGHGSVARYWGGNVKTREDEAEDFKTSQKRRFMVATPDAGRYGNTWECADLAIYYSSKDNLDHRDQSEFRTMGKTKMRGVDNIDIICPGTVETKILEALRAKINMSSAINGDNYRAWLI